MAAQRLGLEPHIFCVGRAPGRTVTDYGDRPPRPRPGPGRRASAAAGPSRRDARQATDHVLGIHGFALWASAGAMAGRSVTAQRASAPPSSATPTPPAPTKSPPCRTASTPHHGHLNRLRYRAWLKWIRAVDNRLERWGYETTQNKSSSTTTPPRRSSETPTATTSTSTTPPTPPPTPSTRRPARPHPPTDPPQILCVSRQDPRKGVDVLIQALAKIARRRHPLPRQTDRPRPPARAPPQSRQGAGHRPTKSISPAESKTSTPIFHETPTSTSSPPSPKPAAQSPSSKPSAPTTAVIATNIDGMPEDLTNGKDSLLIDPANAKTALATALRTLLQKLQAPKVHRRRRAPTHEAALLSRGIRTRSLDANLRDRRHPTPRQWSRRLPSGTPEEGVLRQSRNQPAAGIPDGRAVLQGSKRARGKPSRSSPTDAVQASGSASNHPDDPHTEEQSLRTTCEQ